MSQCPCCFGGNSYEGETGCQFDEIEKLKAKLANSMSFDTHVMCCEESTRQLERMNEQLKAKLKLSDEKLAELVKLIGGHAGLLNREHSRLNGRLRAILAAVTIREVDAILDKEKETT